jgi:hypothetical protein
MASVGDMPDMTRNVMSFRSCHELPTIIYNALFDYENGDIGQKSGSILVKYFNILNG